MKQVFRRFKGYNKGYNTMILMVNNQDRKRSSGFKVDNSRSDKEIRRNWCTSKEVYAWDTLSRHVISAGSIASVKGRLDRFI